MIIATAGHIDHGKTSLVQALTGVDSDRLPEEQRRGMSIDLGFAYASLTPDLPVGFVDVPGHEKFVRNMLAGVTAVDCALLVVAADDGAMPQTREHLDILDLLGIEHGVIALTKIDRVNDARIAQVTADLEALVGKTSLAGAPVVPVCAPEGTGIAELKDTLARYEVAGTHDEESGFRLAIDRSFSLSGAGLVVTGHVFSGRVQIDDTVVITPQGIQARVRGIHANDQQTQVGLAGQRCALNLAGAEVRKDKVQRGQWAVSASGHLPTQRMDARIRVPATADKPLAHWTPVHLHLGTQDVTARLALLETDTIEPGESGLVRIMPNRPMAAWVGDHFIIRDQSARRTIGGGEVLDAHPPVRGRARPERVEVLKATRSSAPAQAFAALAESAPQGVEVDTFQRGWNMLDSQIETVLGAAKVMLIGREAERVALAPSHWQGLRDAAVVALSEWHAEHPERAGMERTRLRSKLPGRVNDATARAVVAAMRAADELRVHGNLVALPSHKAQLPERDLRLWDKVQPHLGKHSDKPPTLPDLAKELGLNADELRVMAERAVGAGLLVHVKGNRYFTLPRIRDLARVAERLALEVGEDGFGAAAYRDATGIGRNVTIELLEYFDRVGLTRRLGNARRLRRSAEELITELWTDDS